MSGAFPAKRAKKQLELAKKMLKKRGEPLDSSAAQDVFMELSRSSLTAAVVVQMVLND